MSDHSLEETLRRGIQAARRGHHEAAQRLLTEVVEADPQQEAAWLWLARTTDDAAQKTAYLQQALALNPDNKWAAEQLAGLSAAAPAATPLPPPGQPQTKIVELKCPNCAGIVSVHNGAGVKTAVCTHCGSVLDLTAEQLAILGQVDPKLKPRKPIEPGMQATFDGKTYEVFGWIEYKGWDDEEQWTWDEWLLMADDNTARWLSYDPEAGFLVQERLETYTPFNPETARTFETPYGRAVVMEHAPARITAVRGELTWRASVGDQIRYLEARGKRHRYTVEYSKQELEVYAGLPMPEADVWRAFGREDRAEKAEDRKLRPRIAAAFALASWALALYTLFPGQALFTGEVQLVPGQVQQIGPVEITNPGRAHQITLQSSSLPTDTWALVTAWALDEKQTKYHLFSATFWDETGVDSDGSWHEWDETGDHLFKPVTAGVYMLEIDYEEAQPANMPLSVTVKIEEGVWLTRYFVILGTLCTLLWFFTNKRST